MPTTRSQFWFFAAANLMAGLALSACASKAAPRDDVDQINTALLSVLTSRGTDICVDRAAYGKPLAIFRTMIAAPDPTRRVLAWYPPGPLDDTRDLSRQELVGAEIHHRQVVIGDRADTAAPLSLVAQAQLNAVAKSFSLIEADRGVAIRESTEAPRATVRWWLRNRFDSRCATPYTITPPVVARGVAFASVTAGHRGTTYALRKHEGRWSVIARWSDWLY